ncbi:hypothetical protein VOLCADRAFT_119538, partial [Volvox carteri f. nagariensis]
VVQLQKLLAERDAELFALRAQLAELQPTEIADMVKEGPAAGPVGQFAMTATARPVSSMASSSSNVDGVVGAATTGLGILAPSPSGAMSRDSAVLADGSPSAPTAAAALTPDRGAGRSADRTGNAEPALANGQDGQRAEGSLSPSNPAAAAAAAVRRMQSLAASHDAPTLLHPGSVPARPVSTGPTVSGATVAVGAGSAPAAAAARGLATVGSVPQRTSGVHGGPDPPVGIHSQAVGTSQQAVVGATAGAPTTGPSSDGHIAAAAAPGVMMQRSTSATLPAAVTGTSTAATTAAGQYVPLAQHHLVGTTATANGRPRPQGVDTAPGPSSTAALTTTSSKPTSYMQTSSAGASVATVGATSNGIGGVLHAAAQSLQDGLPSYRNAAAGVLSTGQPGAGGHALPTSAAAAAANMVPGPGAPMLPVSPSAAAAAGTAASGAHKRVEDGSSAVARAAAAARHMAHPVAAATASSTDGAFSAQSARIMMQQAQRASLAFNTPPAVSSAKRMAASTQLDSPGLEDFAHIGLIDDLLTE